MIPPPPIPASGTSPPAVDVPALQRRVRELEAALAEAARNMEGRAIDLYSTYTTGSDDRVAEKAREISHVLREDAAGARAALTPPPQPAAPTAAAPATCSYERGGHRCCGREGHGGSHPMSPRLVDEKTGGCIGSQPPAPASEPAQGAEGIYKTHCLRLQRELAAERAAHEATMRDLRDTSEHLGLAKDARDRLAAELAERTGERDGERVAHDSTKAALFTVAAELRVAREALGAAAKALRAGASCAEDDGHPFTAIALSDAASRAALAATQGTPAVAPRCPLREKQPIRRGWWQCSKPAGHGGEHFMQEDAPAVASRVPTCEVSGRPCEENPASERHCRCRECQAHLRDVLAATQGKETP